MPTEAARVEEGIARPGDPIEEVAGDGNETGPSTAAVAGDEGAAATTESRGRGSALSVIRMLLFPEVLRLRTLGEGGSSGTELGVMAPCPGDRLTEDSICGDTENYRKRKYFCASFDKIDTFFFFFFLVRRA